MSEENSDPPTEEEVHTQEDAKVNEPALEEGAGSPSPEDGPSSEPKKLERKSAQLDTVVAFKPSDLDFMGEAMPGVNKAVVKKAREQIKTEADPNAKGEKFDPEIHATDAEGKPIPLKSGKGYRKKRGRAKTERVAIPKGPAPKVDEDEIPIEMRIKSDALVLTELTDKYILAGILDIETKPKERKEMNGAYEKSLLAYGKTLKIPPWSLPLFVVGGIVIAHKDEEKPKTRREIMKVAMAEKWVGFKRWRAERKVRKELKKKDVEKDKKIREAIEGREGSKS